MKQALFFNNISRRQKMYVLTGVQSSIDTLAVFYTLMFRVFQGLFANILELKKFYICFKLFYDGASPSACS